MPKTKKTPNLRFPEFTAAWEQRKLGDVYKITSGGTPSRSTQEYWGGSIPWITTTNVDFNEIILCDEFITEKGLDNSSAKIFPEDTILVAMYGQGKTRGKSAILKIKATTNQACAALLPTEFINSRYTFTYLSSQYDNLRELSNEGGQKNLSLGILNQVLLFTPSLAEQIKIGAFFQEFDNLIAIHQRKLEALKEQKKGLLQQMFPKDGANIPELRFPEFTDVWEQRKLGEVTQITMGQSPNSENYTQNPDDYILVQGNADMKNGRVVPRVWTTQVTKEAEKGDLILSVRAPVGDIGKTDFDVVLGRGVAAIKGNEFIFQSLGKMKQNGFWTKLSTGSTFDSINSTDIKDAHILIPSLDEQTKIGAFFQEFDNLIAIHQRKLEALQEQKKGLLQQMFV